MRKPALLSCIIHVRFQMHTTFTMSKMKAILPGRNISFGLTAV
ncbi:hypothetical protein HanXRQr2_Chr12g0522291 [Helianthus annuus]|uniref:Uncharacterized protein n=1 Tax=Helianthus annuus TaxID=4232 RepID=A0A9K3HEP9_HELAN|nr:hypothetical protein HanXRQr2_Chr12g0522291 [Helianthus annuus]